MTLDQIRYFLATAEEEHLGKASKRLAISPSAISHAIALLEGEFGEKLFHRRGKRIVLTPRGANFRDESKELVAHARRVQEGMTAKDVPLKGRMNIAASHGLSSALATPCLAKLQQRHPDVQVEIFSLRSSEVIQSVIEGRSDCGICFSPLAHPEIEISILKEGHLYPYVRSKHPVLKSNKSLKELNQYKACMPKAFAGIEVCEVHPMLEGSGIVPDVNFIFDSYLCAAEFVLKTNAWGFFPEWLAEEFSGLKKVNTKVNWEAAYSISAIIPRSRGVSRAVTEYLEFLKDHSCAVQD